jgi:hypothetical protein
MEIFLKLYISVIILQIDILFDLAILFRGNFSFVEKKNF